jgi:hypothetical protein
MRIIYGTILSYGVLVYLLVLTVLVDSVAFRGGISRIPDTNFSIPVPGS